MRGLICKYFLLILVLLQSTINSYAQPAKKIHQRVIILMIDGFGEAYYRNSEMPVLNDIEKHGIYKVVPSLMPSVTNLNNASIVTGELPEMHGITGNSFVDPISGTEEFMEESNLVLTPTLFERAEKQGVHSKLFASKKKTICLLNKGTTDTISPETASAIWISRIGTPPNIYSCEVNYWLMEAALYSIVHDTAPCIIYIHPTDYPMHTWAPESIESKTYLHKMDEYIGRIRKEAPDAAILITADHTVTHKNFCWDLNKACSNRNTPIKLAISDERDKYFKHHRGFGGTAYVYLHDSKNAAAVKKTIQKLQGVEEVLTNQDAAKRFHLMPERIGDLVVLGDRNTVFGDLDTESESLPETYRSHGSIYDAKVPLFIYNAKGAPGADFFQYNYQLAAWLYR